MVLVHQLIERGDGAPMEQIANANFGLALGAILILLGILSSLLASRFGTPLLLVFLVVMARMERTAVTV